MSAYLKRIRWQDNKAAMLFPFLTANVLDGARAANFRQTICFRTEDRATIERMNFLLGAVDVARLSENVGSSTNVGPRNSSSSAGYGLSLQRQNVINPQLFRQFRQNDALALLSISGTAYDDVLKMLPVFT